MTTSASTNGTCPKATDGAASYYFNRGADAMKPKGWTKGKVQAKREDALRLYLGRLKVSSLPCRFPPAAFASCSQPLPRNGS
jgi:hypothetical protein